MKFIFIVVFINVLFAKLDTDFDKPVELAIKRINKIVPSKRTVDQIPATSTKDATKINVVNIKVAPSSGSYVHVLFDTGSSDLYLGGSACTNCSKEAPYNPPYADSVSISCTDPTIVSGLCACSSSQICQTTAQYGDGTTFIANNWQDDLSIQGQSSLSSTGAIIGQVVSSNHAGSEGIFGFNFASRSSIGKDSNIFRYFSQNNLYPAFRYSLGAPSLILGQNDHSTSGYQFFSIKDNDWRIVSSAFQGPDGNNIFASSENLIDTGTSGIGLIQPLYQALESSFKKICVGGSPAAICSNDQSKTIFQTDMYLSLTPAEVDALPSFSIIFGNYKCTIGPKEYLFNTGMNNFYLVLIFNLGPSFSYNVLGGSFLLNYDTNYDAKTMEIGIKVTETTNTTNQPSASSSPTTVPTSNSMVQMTNFVFVVVLLVFVYII